MAKGQTPPAASGGMQEEEAKMNKIRKELLYSTKALLSGRDYGKNPTPVEEESRRELMKVEAEALRIALRPPLSQNLRKLLPILVDANDEFVPISRLAERAELCSEGAVRTALARLNRIAEGSSDMTWTSFLLGNDEIGYRLPDHLREVVREALEANRP